MAQVGLSNGFHATVDEIFKRLRVSGKAGEGYLESPSYLKFFAHHSRAWTCTANSTDRTDPARIVPMCSTLAELLLMPSWSFLLLPSNRTISVLWLRRPSAALALSILVLPELPIHMFPE
ncbi:hypothetical protein Y032_0001g219 [Ancylostoma ceylanicum]|uniref:Uncharacterized protein n=1 Tax=Ancylostoma ceylanicum TaxID=53326 RepID=A0A016W2L2_9BILA|nr:hypothetical protein Y032_0001g219 [Ancylostoma ceylanicum]